MRTVQNHRTTLFPTSIDMRYGPATLVDLYPAKEGFSHLYGAVDAHGFYWLCTQDEIDRYDITQA